jgi:hypothetical protein
VHAFFGDYGSPPATARHHHTRSGSPRSARHRWRSSMASPSLAHRLT